MALKDWKQNIQGRSMWRWKHKDKIAEIEVETKQYPLLSDKYYTVSVNVFKYNNKNITASYDRFKTKSQALKFAKSYMRTH